MAEPDWTDVAAVRSWLELRYPLASGEKDSPFYQYLVEEQRKGNDLRRREKHLSRGIGGELFKWFDEQHAENSLFNYPIEHARFIYYPEFIDQDQFSRSGSQPSEEDEFFNQNEAFAILNSPQAGQVLSKPFIKRAKPRSQKVKPVVKCQAPKSPCPAPAGTKLAKQARGRNVPGVGKRKGTRETGNSLARQRERISTLRPRRDGKRPKTDFFHPDRNARVRKPL